ncbi:MAG: hypothetical protein PVJ86_00030 [Phycisphaerales bacterium]|jgi:hypothetical protein
MAKKKHDAQELAAVIDAVVDHQLSLSSKERDAEALPKAIAALNMESPAGAAKKAKKPAPKKAATTPKPKEG